jgi:hypothetical protein
VNSVKIRLIMFAVTAASLLAGAAKFLGLSDGGFA